MFSKIRDHKKAALRGIAIGAIAGIASLAAAAWLTSDHGSAKGKWGKVQPITVTAAPAANEVIYPGESSAGSMTVTNPNSRPLTVVRVARNSQESPTGKYPGLVTVNEQTNLSIPLPPGTSNIDVPGLFTAAAEVPDDAQDAEFTVPVELFARAGN
jgi:hypothetical protein